MSTRCNIIVKEEFNKEAPIYVYHHFDGYPEGVGAELKEIITKHYTQGHINPVSVAQQLYDYDDLYEESDGIHGDIEYLYVLTVMDDMSIKYQCIDVPLIEDYNYKTLENCEQLDICFLKPGNLGEEEKELEEIYPTFEEGLAFVGNNCYYTGSKENLKAILKTFHNYMNTPVH